MASTEWDKPVERMRLKWRITDELGGLYYSERACNGWPFQKWRAWFHKALLISKITCCVYNFLLWVCVSYNWWKHLILQFTLHYREIIYYVLYPLCLTLKKLKAKQSPQSITYSKQLSVDTSNLTLILRLSVQPLMFSLQHFLLFNLTQSNSDFTLDHHKEKP